jgi:hypothetical protein
MIFERFENSSRLFVWLGGLLLLVSVCILIETSLFLNKAQGKATGVIDVSTPVKGTKNYIQTKSVIDYKHEGKPYLLYRVYPIFGNGKEVPLRYDLNDPTNVRVAVFSIMWLPSIILFIIGDSLILYSIFRKY